MRLTTRSSILCLLVFCLQGCLTRQSVPEPDLLAAYPQIVEPSPGSGGIYRDGRAVALFDDLKAHNVGDILTVLLVERTDATKSSSTSTSKSTSGSATNPTLFGRPVTHNGDPLLSAAIDASSDFSGEGDSTQSNRLAGSVTVMIVQRLPNGNLFVRGQKRIALNQGDEFVSVSGIVRPADITTSNTVTSDRIANSEISYSGKGPLADANRMGILARFFNSPRSIFRRSSWR